MAISVERRSTRVPHDGFGPVCRPSQQMARAGPATTRAQARTRKAGPWIAHIPCGTPSRRRGLAGGATRRQRPAWGDDARASAQGGIQLNEESLWTRPIGRRENPLALARLGEVRDALLHGDGRRAHFLAELGSFGVPRSQAAYQTLGHLTLLSFGHHEEWATQYKRSLDLRGGIARLSYRLGNVEHRREIFASAPDQVIVVHLEAGRPLSSWASSCGGGSTAGAMPSDGTSSSSTAAAGPTAPASWPGAVWSRMAAPPKAWATIFISPAPRPLPFCWRWRAIFPGWSLRKSTRNCLLKGRCPLSNGPRPWAGTSSGERHLADHAVALGSFDLDLTPNFPDLEELPTDARLARLRQGRDDAGLVQLYTMFGRYLLAGSSRPGTCRRTSRASGTDRSCLPGTRSSLST